MEPILILGIDSFIGATLKIYLESKGIEVWGTTRRTANIGPKTLYLDLSADIKSWIIPSKCFKAAVFCCGVTSIKDCGLNPESSRKVNLDSTIYLANRLAKEGIFIIFLSSNKVFDGTVPWTPPNHKLTPTTEYGLQKSIAENEILKLGEQSAIVRFTKIVTPKMPLIQNWIDHLRNSRKIYPYSNMVISPIPVEFVIQVLDILLEKKISGITQVSAKFDISYEKIAYYLAYLMNIEDGLIDPIVCTEGSNNSTLDIGRLQQDFGMEPPSILNTLNNLLSAAITNDQKG